MLSKHSLESRDSALHLLLPGRKPQCWLLWWLQGMGSPGLARGQGWGQGQEQGMGMGTQRCVA